MTFDKDNKEACETLQELTRQSPGSWGSTVWETCRVMALKYDSPKAEDFQLVQNIMRAVPCPSCAAHIDKVLGETKVADYVGTPFGVLRFVFDVHNSVNKKLGRAELSYDDCLQATAESLHDTLEESSERQVGKKRLVLFGVGLLAGTAWYMSRKGQRARLQ